MWNAAEFVKRSFLERKQNHQTNLWQLHNSNLFRTLLYGVQRMSRSYIEIVRERCFCNFVMIFCYSVLDNTGFI